MPSLCHTGGVTLAHRRAASMSPPMSRSSRALGCTILACALALSSGCITVTAYQPLLSLQRPVVIDPEVTNFEGMRLLIRCNSNAVLPPFDAEKLCNKVGTSFTAQGAEVDQEVPRPGSEGGGAGDPSKPPDLTIDIVERSTPPQQDNAWLVVLSAVTLTLVPVVTEYRMAQDIIIRDRSGFLLSTDRVEGRFVEYFGIGFYAVNWALDLLLRGDDDDVMNGAAQRDFSRDYYGQLSQQVFNARVRQQLLRGFKAE
jgi:hypothetical protein